MRQVDCDKAQRFRYWSFLRKAQSDYVTLTHGTEYGGQKDFEYYLEANYGIKPMIAEGNYTGSYTIVDEKKMLLTKLKYDF